MFGRSITIIVKLFKVSNCGNKGTKKIQNSSDLVVKENKQLLRVSKENEQNTRNKLRWNPQQSMQQTIFATKRYLQQICNKTTG